MRNVGACELQSATIFQFYSELSGADRSVNETLALRVAQHPSESPEYMVTRLLAYALEFTDGIGFSRGVSEPEEPTVAVRDLTGAIKTWIEIGPPDAGRLHKASKPARRLAGYPPKDPPQRR